MLRLTRLFITVSLSVAMGCAQDTVGDDTSSDGVVILDRDGVVVNDLYPVVEQAGRDVLLSTDGVHFNDRGKQVLGLSVARFIRAA